MQEQQHPTHGHLLSPSKAGQPDVDGLAAALAVGDTATVQALLFTGGVGVNDELLFWGYGPGPGGSVAAATSLHFAAHVGSATSVAWLLSVGADPSRADSLGRSPGDVTTSEAVRGVLAQGVALYKGPLMSPGKHGKPKAPPRPSHNPRITEHKEDAGIAGGEGEGEPALPSPHNGEDRALVDRRAERAIRRKSLEAQESLSKPTRIALQALEASLSHQLSEARQRQGEAAACAQRVHDAGVRVLSLLSLAEAAEEQEARTRKNQVEHPVVQRANETLGALDCRAAVMEAQATEEPPTAIRHLLISVHQVIQEAALPASSPKSADTGWPAAHAFLHSDDFLDAMYQASPERLAGRPAALAGIKARLAHHNISEASVGEVFAPMYVWLATHVAAAEELSGEGGGVAAAAAVQACWDEVREGKGALAEAQTSQGEAAIALSRALTLARATLADVTRQRTQFGLSPAGLWDGSDDLNATVSEQHTAVTRLRAGRSTDASDSDSKMYSPGTSPRQASPARRRSDASPPTGARPLSREASPLVRHRRASVESGGGGGSGGKKDRWGESKEVPNNWEEERWPAGPKLPLAVDAPGASDSSPRALARRSLQPALDSPQLRRVRLSSVEASIDPEVLALAKGTRSQRSGSESSPDTTELSGGTEGNVSPAQEGEAVPPLPLPRRTSIVQKASPLRRKSNVGMGLVGDMAGEAAAAAAQLSPKDVDPSLQRVRRMSIDAGREPLDTAQVFGLGLGAEAVAAAGVAGKSSPSPVPPAAAHTRRGSALANPAVVVDSVTIGDVLSPAALLRRNSTVQRPSPLRRLSSVDAGAVPPSSERTPMVALRVASAHASPDDITAAEPPMPFISPGASAFRRCLTGSVSPPPKSPTPPTLSPNFPTRGVTSTDPPAAALAPDVMRLQKEGAVHVPGRTPVRALPDGAALALNMGDVNTPLREEGVRPLSGRLSLSARRSSVKRLADALAYGEELAVRAGDPLALPQFSNTL